MTHIPTAIVYAEERDREAAIRRAEDWCGKEAIKKYGIEFLSIKEALAKEINLEHARDNQYSPISLDETARAAIESKPYEDPKTEQQSRADKKKEKKKKAVCKKWGKHHRFDREHESRRGYPMRYCQCGRIQFQINGTWTNREDMPDELKQAPEIIPIKGAAVKPKNKKRPKIEYRKGHFLVNGEVRTKTNKQL